MTSADANTDTWNASRGGFCRSLLKSFLSTPSLQLCQRTRIPQVAFLTWYQAFPSFKSFSPLSKIISLQVPTWNLAAYSMFSVQSWIHIVFVTKHLSSLPNLNTFWNYRLKRHIRQFCLVLRLQGDVMSSSKFATPAFHTDFWRVCYMLHAEANRLSCSDYCVNQATNY